MTRRTSLLVLAAIAAACVSDNPTGPPTLASTAVEPIVAFAAGDCCGRSSSYKDKETSDIIVAEPNAVVLLAGDLAYPDGTALDFQEAYHPTWGRFLGRTHPSPGNHEYHTVGQAAGAPGYFGYFGSRAPAPYYKVELGNGWLHYSLNTEIAHGTGSAQLNWLKADLAANPRTCVSAAWHRPLYTSGSHSPSTSTRAMFRVLYLAGADLVVWGHNHQYEHFLPQDDSARVKPAGVVAFTVGTGGASLTSTSSAPAKNTVTRINGQHGVLRLELSEGGYSHVFKTIGGASLDAGSASCSGSTSPPPPPPEDTTPPPPPPPPPSSITLTVTGARSGTDYRNTLLWSGATGDSVDVWKDGAFKKRELNDGKYTNQQTYHGPATYTYKVCLKASTTACSNSASVSYP